MKAGLPLLALTLTLAACAPAAKAPPVASAPAPAARPAPARPAPAPVLPAGPGAGWMDAPLTPGAWRYHQHEDGTSAYFLASTGAGGFVMTCNATSGRLELWRETGSTAPRALTIRTETAAQALSAFPVEDTLTYLAADLPPDDRLLDAMALSKGRFAVEAEGEQPLYLPSHAEVSRVIEDCR